jgi:hypothetical protein
MAQVKIADVVDHLSSEMTRALEHAVEQTMPGVHFDRVELFRNFKRAVYRKCSIWESVPDRYVKID